jgi:hypothetical protein
VRATPRGQIAAAAPKRAMKSRRLIACPVRLRTKHRSGSKWHTGSGQNGARRCPLWVKSRHRSTSASCPLYPQKRTSELGPHYARRSSSGSLAIFAAILRALTGCTSGAASTKLLFEIQFGGRSFCGSYALDDDGFLTVRTPFGSKARQLGKTSAILLARILLKEMAADGQAKAAPG